MNGKAAKKNTKFSAGDTVIVQLPEPEPVEVLPQNIPLDVVYEDQDVIVVNKPVGMVVHPAPGHSDGTLVNALLYACGGVYQMCIRDSFRSYIQSSRAGQEGGHQEGRKKGHQDG